MKKRTDSASRFDHGREEGASSTVYYTDETGETRRYSTEKVQGQFHGAGDVYAGAFVGALANGLSLEDAVRVSRGFYQGRP